MKDQLAVVRREIAYNKDRLERLYEEERTLVNQIADEDERLRKLAREQFRREA